MAVAGRSEGVAVRVVGGLGAAVGGPDEGGWVLGLAVAAELGERDAEEVLVRGLLLGGTSLDHIGASLGSRGESRDGGEEGDEGGELHFEGWLVVVEEDWTGLDWTGDEKMRVGCRREGSGG